MQNKVQNKVTANSRARFLLSAFWGKFAAPRTLVGIGRGYFVSPLRSVYHDGFFPPVL